MNSSVPRGSDGSGGPSYGIVLMAHALPSDWQDVIARVSGWLADATTQLDRHESEFVLRFPTTETPVRDTSALNERLAELPRLLAPLATAAAEADAAAREPETALRDV